MSGDKPDHAGVRVPPPLIFLGLTLVGPVFDRLLAVPPLDFGRAVRTVLIVILVTLGLTLVLAAIRRFQRAGTRAEPWAPSSAIVCDGIYRFTRNPMYVGMALVMLGLALVIGSISSLAMVAVAILVVDRYVIRREEAYLEAKFGSAYNEYRRRVRRWL